MWALPVKKSYPYFRQESKGGWLELLTSDFQRVYWDLHFCSRVRVIVVLGFEGVFVYNKGRQKKRLFSWKSCEK